MIFSNGFFRVKQMELNLLFYGVATILYLVVGLKIVTSFKKQGDVAPAWTLLAAGVAIVCHFWVLQGATFPAKATMTMDFGIAVSAICFFASLMLFYGALYSQVQALFAIVCLVSAAGVWAPILFSNGQSVLVGSPLSFKMHIAMGLIAYAFMIMAIVQAILMGILNRRLRNHDMLKEPAGLVASMPDLMSMERMLFRLVFACFVFLMLTIAGGALSSTQIADATLFGHKTVLTGISCAIFGVLVLGRRFFGWRSRQALTLFWIAVVCQVIAFLVYRFVLDVL